MLLIIPRIAYLAVIEDFFASELFEHAENERARHEHSQSQAFDDNLETFERKRYKKTRRSSHAFRMTFSHL